MTTGIVALLAVVPTAVADDAAIEFFESKVRPLLLNRCAGCHGADEQEAGLRLDTAAGVFGGGDSGPAVVPAEPQRSRIIQAVRGDDPQFVMPPDDRLSNDDVAILVRWVKQGAVWPGADQRMLSSAQEHGPLFTDEQKAFWAFQSVSVPDVPAIEDSWIRTPVDAFILEQLQQHALRPSAAADRYTLLRRVTFDLTGLPPTPDEIHDFIADTAPDAWQRVVERLLASPAYGEKWGRYWLDTVRFAESAGHDGNNGYLYAWRYRDYVIDAFNRDLPYNEFIIEQLAGDLLPPTGNAQTDLGRLIATGFLQVGPKPVVMRDKKQMLLDIADEQLSTTGVAFLGLTIGCARCHDHKFDPIPTADYYSLAGIFMSTHVMFDKAADSMWLEPEVDGPNGEKIRVMAVQDQQQPADVRVNLRGNYRTPGEVAPRRFLQIIAGEDHAQIETSGSGRLELARWVADADHPLTARVMVNRVWQQHFGRGIVASTGDFGSRGDRPTHPELLDWLADFFVREGWSVKALHRLMLLSSTWQQSSSTAVSPVDSETSDPENHLLWRMPRRRLTAEEIRDSLLAVSGALDRQSGGTLFTSGYNFNRKDVGLSTVDIGSAENYAPFQAPRRSIYLPMLRNQMHPMLALFDMANEHIPVTDRDESTVATQSLFLVNSPFVRKQAQNLAEQTVDAEAAERISSLWLKVLGRPPMSSQTEAARQFLAAYRDAGAGGDAWLSLCQALLCMNEFIYVD